MENYLQCGHSLFMNNLYNSVELANIYCIGTLCNNRKENPCHIVEAKLLKRESKASYRNGVVGKWRNKRYVLYISTEYKNELQECLNKRGEAKVKPLPIIKYNESMCGVDRQDQMLSYYPCEQKTLRWYKKIRIHIIQPQLLNSFYLYNMYSGQKLICMIFDCRL